MNLPEIKQVNKFENGVRLSLYVNPELNVFDGHFDDVAIVAGVIQISWALSFCNQELQKIAAYEIECIESLKFLRIITPGMQIELNLELKNSKLLFSFVSEHEKYSSGKIVLT